MMLRATCNVALLRQSVADLQEHCYTVAWLRKSATELQEHWGGEEMEPYDLDSLSLAVTFAVRAQRAVNHNDALNETAGDCVEMWRKIVFRSNELTYGTKSKTELEWCLTEYVAR